MKIPRKLLGQVATRQTIISKSNTSDLNKTVVGFEQNATVIPIETSQDHLVQRSNSIALKPPIKFNKFGVPLIPSDLHKTLFGQEQDVNQIEETRLKKAQEHLEHCGIEVKEEPLKDTSYLDQLPNLDIFQNIQSHFEQIGHDQVKPYLDAINAAKDIPKVPSSFEFKVGWTRYENGTITSVPFPSEDLLTFDIETCVREGGEFPVMATAVSSKAWYSWCSPYLIDKSKKTPKDAKYLTKDDLISIGTPLLVIGHNVSFDRARIAEQYDLELNPTRFMDTMALHISVCSMTSGQRKVKMKQQNDPEKMKQDNYPVWTRHTSTNGLNELVKFYLKDGKGLDKATRDVFVKGDMDEIRADFQNLMKYCALDVQATFKVFQKLFPIFRRHCPHPVTLSGMLTMGVAYLPTNDCWDQYIKESDNVTEEMESAMENMLARQAKETCQLYNVHQNDIWTMDLDWQCTQLKVTTKKRPVKPLPIDDQNDSELDRLSKKFLPLLSQVENLQGTQPCCPGYPKWYSELCSKYDPRIKPEPTELGFAKTIVPKLLRLTWNGNPLFRSKIEKWGYLVKEASGEPQEGIPEGYTFHKLPHQSYTGGQVGNPLAKNFIEKINSGELSSDDEGNDTAKKILQMSKSLSYWRSSHDRIRSQILVKNGSFKVILPQIVTSGTLTRRAVEKTWLTASNAKPDRVGSELKAMVMAPDGYKFVGADVDSQELWIAAVIGDAHFTAEHGSTALGWMTLQGNKAAGTDMHSVTAETAKVSRDQAKILNYARIYGAGIPFAAQLLKAFNPKISGEKAKSNAVAMFRQTKGIRTFRLNSKGDILNQMLHHGINNQVVSLQEVNKLKEFSLVADQVLEFKGDGKVKIKDNFLETLGDVDYDADQNIILEKENLAKVANVLKEKYRLKKKNDRIKKERFDPKSVDDSVLLIGKSWQDGTESHTFNSLEDIAISRKPRTPVLDCLISDALVTYLVGDDYMPSRINWVVQSSAVDYLHLLLSSLQWLFNKYEIQGRFVISIHDEVRYLVKEEDAYRAALALQMANMMVRAMFCSRLGMNSMPLSIAFFSGVDIDKTLRKEPTADCVTPSNPQGLLKGYGIEHGECLDIQQLIAKTNGKLSNHGCT